MRVRSRSDTPRKRAARRFDALFDAISTSQMAATVIGYAETFSLLLRKRNRNDIATETFAAAKSLLRNEIVSDTDFSLLTPELNECHGASGSPAPCPGAAFRHPALRLGFRRPALRSRGRGGRHGHQPGTAARRRHARSARHLVIYRPEGGGRGGNVPRPARPAAPVTR